ncbi:GNAT family N-acetyltransferase [Rehaibacterium terrae]|uniref:RimJ/RimL family protein N-acetyltransferase n=1 Tax=Rehaibacterium terrae TaxID=1341696 RepID=A0A7W7XYP0_9GAMM|nr:GNAT family N-acetyltransferase [Rehaibacterium terrae]MBB5014857.1 RimJ/RimL family protein N-acetyltransferase [Rehaibacterium terrae]
MSIVSRQHLSQPWHERLVLDDGRELVLRPIDPADAEPLRAAFSLLSREEIRQRFLHVLTELTPEHARRLTTLDPQREFALVVAEPLPPGEALVVAVARAAIDDDGRHAEFAVLVGRPLAGRGLGRLLMKRLIRWARLKRLESLYGDVLEDNTAMLTLARALGFRREPLPASPGVTRVRLALAERSRG